MLAELVEKISHALNLSITQLDTLFEILRNPRTPHQQRVDAFMRKAGQALPLYPQEIDDKTRILRAKLILEEAMETIEALGVEIFIKDSRGKVLFLAADIDSYEANQPMNLVEVADGCADLSVVTIGTLSACGISDRELLEVVDQNNLDKFEVPECKNFGCDQLGTGMVHTGKGVYYCKCNPNVKVQGPYRAEDGKWVKSPNHKPPDIARLLAKQEAEGLLTQAAEGQTTEPIHADCPACNDDYAKSKRSEESPVKIELASDAIARIVGGAEKQAICGNCKTPLSDELYRKVRERTNYYLCPGCVQKIKLEDVVHA